MASHYFHLEFVILIDLFLFILFHFVPVFLSLTKEVCLLSLVSGHHFSTVVVPGVGLRN